MKLHGKKVNLLKLEDTKFNGMHPRDVNVGFTNTGTASDLVVGSSFYVGLNWATSTVTEIVEETESSVKFRTLNSLYIAEIIAEKPLSDEPELGVLYKHYKGGTYEVIMFAQNTETKESMVIYKNIEHSTMHARPYKIWMEDAVLNGNSVGRFVRFQNLIKNGTN